MTRRDGLGYSAFYGHGGFSAYTTEARLNGSDAKVRIMARQDMELGTLRRFCYGYDLGIHMVGS